MVQCPGEMRRPGHPDNFQGSPAPSSRMIPVIRKSSKSGKRPSWMNKELLIKLQHKKEEYKRLKQDHISWEEYRHLKMG